jgi:hypothetical protein
LNRPVDIRFHQPVEMDNGRDAGDVNQAVELLPPFTQPPNHGRRRSRRQRDQENESASYPVNVTNWMYFALPVGSASL